MEEDNFNDLVDILDQPDAAKLYTSLYEFKKSIYNPRAKKLVDELLLVIKDRISTLD